MPFKGRWWRLPGRVLHCALPPFHQEVRAGALAQVYRALTLVLTQHKAGMEACAWVPALEKWARSTRAEGQAQLHSGLGGDRMRLEAVVSPWVEYLVCGGAQARSSQVPTLACSFPSTEPSKSSIMPFRALKRPLQFLGLFETSLCRLTHIPAYKVRGGVGGWGRPGTAQHGAGVHYLAAPGLSRCVPSLGKW